MKLSVSKVLADDKERKAKPTPLPEVRIQGKVHTYAPAKEKPVEKTEPIKQVSDTNSVELARLADELGHLKRTRGKLASHTAKLINDIEQLLLTEGQGVLNEFRRGNLPMPELARHYQQMNDLTDQAADVWDQIRAIESGVPMQELSPINEQELADLKNAIRRHDDFIHKTRMKLQKILDGSKQKNYASDWIADYKERIAIAETNRELAKRKLKQLQYGRA